MKDNRHKETARRFGILAQCEALENDLLKIPGVVEIDFDLDVFFDNMNQVILLVKYDIDVSLPDYFDARRELQKSCIMVMLAHGLNPSGDPIEDYGQHFYFVRQCSHLWRESIKPFPVKEFILYRDPDGNFIFDFGNSLDSSYTYYPKSKMQEVLRGVCVGGPIIPRIWTELKELLNDNRSV